MQFSLGVRVRIGDKQELDRQEEDECKEYFRYMEQIRNDLEGGERL